MRSNMTRYAASVVFAIVWICAAAAAVGPKLTEAELVAALDLERPGLEPVRDAVRGGDMDAARAALAEYYRTRDSVEWLWPWRGRDLDKLPEARELDDLTIYGREEADAAVEHRFTLVGVEHAFDGPIDWRYNPTAAPDSEYAVNHEWTWVLNRQRFWLAMGRAWWATGDSRYAEEFVRQLLDWTTRCPVPEGEANQDPLSPWRTIDAGIRMSESWPHAYHFFLTSPAFTDEALLVFLRSVLEHGRYLMAHPTDYNWLTIEMKGLYFAGGVFPEFREAAAWRRFAIGRLREELDVQFYPDGTQKELSPSIHNRVIGGLLDVGELARRNEYPLPDGYMDKLETAYAANRIWVLPDGGVPLLQDCWRVHVPRALRRAHQFWPRHDFAWFASEGAAGAPPDFTSARLPWAGYLVMRSGWENGARYLAFDAGPYGGKHQHEDKLTLWLAAYGRNLLVEAASYAYEKSKWRQFTLDSFGHNVLIVDGRAQQRRFYLPKWNAETPLPCVWAPGERFDYAEASFGGEFEKYRIWNKLLARHTRRIFYVKAGEGKDFWVVLDTAAPMDGESHDFEVLFHLAGENSAQPHANCVATAFDTGANLGIYALDTPGLEKAIVKGQKDPVQGWLPERHGVPVMHPAPVAVYRQSGDTPQHFAFALYPVPEGAPPRLRLSGGVSGDTLQLEAGLPDGRRYRFRCPADPHLGQVVGEVPPGVYAEVYTGAGWQSLSGPRK